MKDVLIVGPPVGFLIISSTMKPGFFVLGAMFSGI
jgi:hypothetical protein